MCVWPSHQYLIGDISLIRSEQSLGLHNFQRLKVCPADPDYTILGMHFPTPPTDSQIQADPSLSKEKTWHLNQMPLAFLTGFRPQRYSTPFIGVIFSVKLSGHPSYYYVLILSHALYMLARFFRSISTGITC